MANKREAFTGPKPPEKTPEQVLAEKKQMIGEVAEWFRRISSQLAPERLRELEAMARFAIANLKSQALSERDKANDSEAAVSEAVAERFQEYHRWLSSKDAQNDTDYFRQKVESWFDDEAAEDHEGLVARMANYMTEDEQREEGLIE